MRNWLTRDCTMNKIHKDTDIDWQNKIRVCFLVATKYDSPSRYCCRSISSFSNRVLSIFRQTSWARTALVFFFWSPLVHFNNSCREMTSSFLRLSIKFLTFGWDLKTQSNRYDDKRIQQCKKRDWYNSSVKNKEEE